ncbi:hypothetical protein BD626DRAFT_496660 [Schizophyllum amplum]|uniref:Secreted protein n=1 Tax=Schizophyllum amplum TaxID=97359 RepID=A0A550CDI4_9AGAR|nr:hypothetical protein BD626DRAFT_496660 [Auriculariopsis ampla]
MACLASLRCDISLFCSASVALTKSCSGIAACDLDRRSMLGVSRVSQAASLNPMVSCAPPFIENAYDGVQHT